MLLSPFTEEDSKAAHEEWGANCGPNALAFALCRNIKDCKDLIPGFSDNGFTNPTMMKAAIAGAGRTVRSIVMNSPQEGRFADLEPMFTEQTSVVRIQWEGPWTKRGANQRWAYRQTHWIATWLHSNTAFVFDVNGGVRNLQSWENDVVPLLVESIPRASGGWFPTHIYRIA